MKPRGLTLIELLIALAVLAVLATLALPSFGNAADRARLKAVAETLAADLADARFEAAQRGMAVHLDYRNGADWCWAVATAPGCRCQVQQQCQLKTVQGRDHAGITLTQAQATAFDAAGMAHGGGPVLLQSGRGEQLRVDISALGRARICAPGPAVPGYARC